MELRSLSATVAVALLVVGAGCSGFGGGGPPDRDPYDVPDPTPTGTPTPTATETFTPTPTGTVVPGIARNEVVSALDAMRSHGLFLLNNSFEVTRTITVRHPNGSIARQQTLQAWVNRNRTEYLARETDRSGDGIAIYANGREALSRVDRSGDIEYELVTPPGGEIPDPGGALGTDLTFTSRVYLYLNGMRNVSVDDLSPDQNGTTRYQFSSTDVENSSIDTVTRGTVSNVSVVIVVDERGLVESIWGIYTLTQDERRLQVFERIDYDGVGSTEVPRPEWVPEARNETDLGG